MCDADETKADDAAGSAVEQIPFHLYVIRKARMIELRHREELAETRRNVDELSEAEDAELEHLLEHYESSDEDVYALLHLSEAIAGGVIIPSGHQAEVKDALIAVYRVLNENGDDGNVRLAVGKALAALGVPESELPKSAWIEEEEEDGDEEEPADAEAEAEPEAEAAAEQDSDDED